MDKLTGMAVFARVVEAQSFTSAAAQLGMSRSAVSKAIAGLEDRLGARLLNRTTRRLALTEVGQAFYERCARIVAEAEDAELEVSRLQAAPRGILRLSAPVSFGILHLAPALPDFMKRYPELRVEIDLADRMVDLIEEGYDLAVRIGALPDSSLIARRLADNHMVVCAAPAYWQRRGRPREPRDLTGHACITYAYQRSPNEWPFAGPGGRFSVRVDGPLLSNNGDLALIMALAGLGVVVAALLPLRVAPGRGPARAGSGRLDAAAGRDPRRLPAWPSPVGQGPGVRRFFGRTLRTAAGLGNGAPGGPGAPIVITDMPVRVPPRFAAWFEQRGWRPHDHQLAMLEAAAAGASGPADRADRRRQDAGGFPAEPGRAGASGRPSGPAHALRLAAQGADHRHRAQPAGADRGDGARRALRDPDRRHAAEPARAPAPRPAGHPADHAGIAGAAAFLPRGAKDVRRPSLRRGRRAARARRQQARPAAGARPRPARPHRPARAASAFRRR